MRLTSPAFPDGTPMPAEHSRDGEDLSPPLGWSDAPPGARSFALACVDRHPAANGWVHWLVVDVPSEAAGLPSGASGTAMPPGSRELPNTFGRAGWGGPQPPRGTGPHTYEFTVYALDVPSLDVPGTASADDVLAAMSGHVLASGTLEGTYSR